MDEAVKSNLDARQTAAASCQAPAATDAVVATVILPAHNEAAALPRVLSALLVVLDVVLGDRYEIIVVDDASTDDTAAIARRHPLLAASAVRTPTISIYATAAASHGNGQGSALA